MPKMHYVRGASSFPVRAFLATMSTDGKLHANFIRSLVQSMPALEAAGIAADFALEAGNCHVDDARNACVKQFKESGADFLVFLDSDVGWEPAGLVALCEAPGDIVTGVYPKKQFAEEYPVRPINGEKWADEYGRVEVDAAPTGFMKISREAIDLLEAVEPKKFIGSDGGEYTILFERTYEDGARWSGDYAFCRKWRKLGEKIYVLPDLKFSHEGHYEWVGCLGDYWRRQSGLPALSVRDALEKLDGTDLKTFIRLREAWGNEWAAPASLLMGLYNTVKGKTVLECGSGLSTIVMAAAGAKIKSLEHDLGHYKTITAALDDLGLDADVIYSPLDIETGWYAQAPPEASFDVLAADGPPRRIGNRAVAFDLECVKNAIWFVDDTDAFEWPGRKAHIVRDIHAWAFVKISE